MSITMQELSSLTRLTQLHIWTPDCQAAGGSLQCLSALHRLRDLDVDVSASCSRAHPATVPQLSHCTALTRLRWMLVPGEVHTVKRIGPVLSSLRDTVLLLSLQLP